MSVIPVLSRGSYAAGILRAERLQTLISALHKGRGHSKSEGSGRYDWDIAAPATHLVTPAAASKVPASREPGQHQTQLPPSKSQQHAAAATQ